MLDSFKVRFNEDLKKIPKYTKSLGLSPFNTGKILIRTEADCQLIPFKKLEELDLHCRFEDDVKDHFLNQIYTSTSLRELTLSYNTLPLCPFKLLIKGSVSKSLTKLEIMDDLHFTSATTKESYFGCFFARLGRFIDYAKNLKILGVYFYTPWQDDCVQLLSNIQTNFPALLEFGMQLPPVTLFSLSQHYRRPVKNKEIRTCTIGGSKLVELCHTVFDKPALKFLLSTICRGQLDLEVFRESYTSLSFKEFWEALEQLNDSTLTR